MDAPAGVRGSRSRAGFFVSGTCEVVEITGEDSRSFLDAQLPADIQSLSEGSGVYTAYLDRKGRVNQDLVLLDLGDRFWALLPHELTDAFIEKLNHYLIREQVTVKDFSGLYTVMELHGPRTPEIMAGVSGTKVELDPYCHRNLDFDGVTVRFVSNPWTGMVGGHLVVKTPDVSAVRNLLLRAGGEDLIEPPADALELLRIEGGHPRFGVDMDERTLLLELGRPDMVSHNKGCYLGQETVARVHSRGQVNRVLMGLLIEGSTVPEPGTPLVQGDAVVGETKSACFSPSLDRVIALAMVRRTAAFPDTVVHLRMTEELVAATVQNLPVYQTPGPKELSRDLYLKGMEAFKGDRFEEAFALFERATLLYPGLFDAYESAGVCLERLGRMDEAEEAMENLVAMAPDHVMGWTNLSRYQAQRGKIQEAEKTMGHVSFLIMKQEAGNKAAARAVKEEAETRKARLTERIDLFRQVLEMDSEDVVANFGLGKLLLDLERFAEAVPHFKTAAANQKNYSMAYKHLATCLIEEGEIREAEAVLRTGIEAATKKGDLIPKRDMTRKLEELIN